MKSKNIKIWLGAAPALIYAGCTAPVQQQKPNVILIYSDDVGYGDLSMNGCTEIETTHIDKLAKNGVNFTNGYVTSSVCGPSRAGILTGKYQQRCGITQNHMPLPLSEKLMPEYLQEQGYKTALFGKWHLAGMKGCFDTLVQQGYHPMDRGFNTFYGFYGCQTSYFNSNRLFEQRDTVYSADYLTDVLAQKTVDFIDANTENPFFIYLAFNATHTPMQVSPKYLNQFNHIKDSTRRVYLGMLKAMDDAIGTVVNEVEKNGLAENTLILFINDNGGKVTTGSVNLPLKGRKYGVFDGGVKVPYIMSWKGVLPRGVLYDNPVSTLDVLPTIMGVLQQPVKGLDGTNILPFINEKTNEVPHEYLYWKSEYSQDTSRKARWNVNRRDWSAVRHGDWKLHKYFDENLQQYIYELYNLKTDPGEQINVITENKEEVAQLKEKLESWTQEMKYAPYPVSLKH